MSLSLVFTAYGQDAYILGDLSVTVQGWTSEAALVRKLEYRAGRTFADRSLLDAYLADIILGVLKPDEGVLEVDREQRQKLQHFSSKLKVFLEAGFDTMVGEWGIRFTGGKLCVWE